MNVIYNKYNNLKYWYYCFVLDNIDKDKSYIYTNL